MDRGSWVVGVGKCRGQEKYNKKEKDFKKRSK